MYKACSKCGKIHDTKYKCNVKRIYADTGERTLRSQYSWTLKSQEIRERANHLCEVCRANGVYTYDNLEVHHIVKVKEDSSLLLVNENLVCLCQDHHRQADKGEIDSMYLKELAKRREQGIN